MSKVTAIISAYYAKQFIVKRLENLLKQEPTPKIIVVCQENSQELETALEYPVHIITTPDIPFISVAWNLGIEAAKTDYVTNANSDDLLLPGALARMAKVLDDNPEYGVVFGNSQLKENGQIRQWKRTLQHTGEYDTKELLNGRYIIGCQPMWKRECGLYNETYRYAQDVEFFVRLASEGVRFYYIDADLGIYTRRHDNNEFAHLQACKAEHMKAVEAYAHR